MKERELSMASVVDARVSSKWSAEGGVRAGEKDECVKYVAILAILAMLQESSRNLGVFKIAQECQVAMLEGGLRQAQPKG